MSQPLRVALVTRSLQTGGAQHHIVKLCQAVSPAEVAISLFLIIQDEANELAPGLPPWVRVHISPFRRHRPGVLKWLADGMRGERAQVVHSFLWHADATAALSRRLFGWVPLVISERGDRGGPGYRSQAGIRRWIDRFSTFPASHWACANSRYGQQLLVKLGYPSGQTTVIPNGVDVARIDAVPPLSVRERFGWPSGCDVVGVVCRLVDYKGVDVFIRAMGRLNASRRVFGVVVGDGVQRMELEQLAAGLGLAERIRFLGRQAQPVALVKDWNVAVLSGRADSEPCSNSILEYMACARPVVATRVGGTPELVVAGETGLLVSRDDPIALAEAIGALLDDPGRAAQMGQRGRERVEEEFKLSTTAERFQQLWHSIANTEPTFARQVIEGAAP